MSAELAENGVPARKGNAGHSLLFQYAIAVLSLPQILRCKVAALLYIAREKQSLLRHLLVPGAACGASPMEGEHTEGYDAAVRALACFDKVS